MWEEGGRAVKLSHTVCNSVKEHYISVIDVHISSCLRIRKITVTIPNRESFISFHQHLRHHRP